MNPSAARGVAVVTGGSRGIGRAIAVEAAARGYDVVIACRKAAEATRAEVVGLGRRGHVVVGDLAELAAVEDLAETARRFGPVHLLVNNAGVTNSGSLDDLDIGRWNETIALNLTAPAWLSRCLAPDLRDNSGSIVNIASTGGVIGSVHSLPYGSSKAGLIGLGKTLARMLAPHVRVNTVCPGPIDTDLLDGITEAQMAEIVGATPLARLGRVGEIGRAVLDISEWTYCTGQTIVVDGGRVMQ